ncbi:carbohydrate porin [Thermodesulfobacteriota bacterium]
MMKTINITSVLMALLFIAPALVWAQTTETRPAAKAITGPDAVDNQLDDDREENPNLLDTNLLKSWEDWKADIADRSGLSFGLDYNALGFAATDSLGDDTSASGAFRLFGTWDFFGRGTKNTGGIVFKVEHRHAYSDVAPSQFGSELGYAGSITPVFSDQGWRTTHLHWRQGFSDGRGVAYAGFLDVTDYVDVYALASPWTAFSNLAFETGSGTIGAIPDGAFGAMVGGFISGNIYAIGGIADANGDATDLTGEFDSFFDDFETFKSLEFGWTSSRKNEPALFLNNFHVTFWQVDERTAAGTPDGWGVAFSASIMVGEHWLPFIRGGWAEDGGSLYEAALAVGFGYQPKGGSNMLGVGLHLSRPNESTFGSDLDDQFTGEIFYKLQVTENFALTPSVQVLGNPALNPDEDLIGLFGLRARLAF